jgi:protein TonB
VQAGDAAAAERYLAAADATGLAATQVRALREQLQAEQQRAALLANVVPESSLKRRHYAVPAYPAAARAKGVEGWVELRYTVTAAGTVEDVEILRASPAGVFDAPVRAAVLEWRYEPRLASGVPTAQRVALRLRFALDK